MLLGVGFSSTNARGAGGSICGAVVGSMRQGDSAFLAVVLVFDFLLSLALVTFLGGVKLSPLPFDVPLVSPKVLSNPSPGRSLEWARGHPTCTSLVLASVAVDARRSDEGRRGTQFDMGDPNDEVDVDEAEAVDLRSCDKLLELSVEELGEKLRALACSDRRRRWAGRRYGWCEVRSWR